MSTALIIGMGDLGERVAAALAMRGRVRRLVLVSRSHSTVEAAAAMLASSSECLVEPLAIDASRQDAVAQLLSRTRPELVVQCASVRSPWALLGRHDPAARAVGDAGLALRLPYQLPVILAVMRAVREAGFTGPVANLSFPDVTGPILARLDLAPTVGLGNAAMLLLRARAALRALDPDAELPLVRVIAHHSQIFDALDANEPADPDDRCRVYVGEQGERDDRLAYAPAPVEPGGRSNQVTAASAVPVLEALLPGAPPRRWTTSAPGGLPGGYPVLIEDGQVSLDLPPGVEREEAIAFNERLARRDGVERIDDDGTVHFTQACRDALAGVAPDLAEPLAISDLEARAARLDAVLG